MGVAQHHDAVSYVLLTLFSSPLKFNLLLLLLLLLLLSGTEKQHVADDYAKRLHIGQVECGNLMGQVISELAAKPGSPGLQFQFCEYINISVCPASETDSVSRHVTHVAVHHFSFRPASQ